MRATLNSLGEKTPRTMKVEMNFRDTHRRRKEQKREMIKRTKKKKRDDFFSLNVRMLLVFSIIEEMKCVLVWSFIKTLLNLFFFVMKIQTIS